MKMCVKTSKKTCNLSCNVAAEKRCCAFYHPRSNLLTTSFVARQVWCGQCDSCTQMTEMNPPDDWLNTGWTRDSQTRTRLVDSLFCITCSLENNAFCLHYVIKVTLHYLTLHRFKIHSVSELSRTALLGCPLAASRLREAARWQLLWIANLVVWVQQNTVLICTFYTPSGSSWHSHQTFCLSIPQAGRAKDTNVKGKITREIGTRKSRTKSVVS